MQLMLIAERARCHSSFQSSRRRGRRRDLHLGSGEQAPTSSIGHRESSHSSQQSSTNKRQRAEAILTMELLDNNAASLSDNRLAPLKSVYFGSNEGRGPVPSVQP